MCVVSLQAVLCILLLSLARSSLIKEGNLTTYGTTKSGNETIQYLAVQDVQKPILLWEELQDNGATIKSCQMDQIVLAGVSNQEDFQVGVVLTFNKDDYLQSGCKLPSNPTELMKRDQLVFREITKVQPGNDAALTVRTTFADGAKVIPTVSFIVDTDAVVSSRSMVDETVLPVTSRFDLWNISLDRREGEFKLNEDIELRYDIEGILGICSLMLDRRSISLSIEIRFQVDLMVGIRVLRAATANIITNPFFPPVQIGTPSFDFFGIDVGFNIFFQLRGHVALEAGTPFDGAVKWSADTGVRIEVGLFQPPRVIGLPDRGEDGSSIFDIDEGSIALGGEINGFFALRPEFIFNIDTPFFDEIMATVGFSGGALLESRTQFPPFGPFTGKGNKFGRCGEPHFLRIAVSRQGRDLSATVTAPFVDEVTLPVRQKFLTGRIGTICAVPVSESPLPEPDPIPEEIIPCDGLRESGNQGEFPFGVQLGETSGTVTVQYDFFPIPDRLTITYEGQTLLDTGLVSGAGSEVISYSGSSTILVVKVDAPRDGTAWEVTVSCPAR